MFACPATEDFFRARLDQMIDLRHPLAVLSSRMPWQELEARLSHLFMRKARAGVAMPDLDLFGESPVRAARASNAGRPRVPLRVMIALLYLKHAFNESDEGVVERWGETPTWQFFSGRAYFEHRRPCDATTLVKFRRLLGEEGVEELLAQTINAAVETGLIKPQELKRVVVDTTVQPKAVAHPTDSRLLETARTKLVEAAKAATIAYARVSSHDQKDDLERQKQVLELYARQGWTFEVIADLGSDMSDHKKGEAPARCDHHRVPKALDSYNGLAKVCQRTHTCTMSTMNISLPETLKAFVDEQVSRRGYGTSSEYVRELIRKDQDRLQLRGLLLAGAASNPATPADAGYFDGLRDRVRKAANTNAKA